jgi:hypothetical protein
MRVRLKYTARINLLSTIGAPNTQVFRHNGLFDPDVTGVGGQPEGFDEWMAFYDRYRVVSSSIKVKAASTGATSAAGSFWLVVVPLGSATVFTTLQDANGSPYAVMKYFSQGGPPITLTQAVSVATLVGARPQAILDELTYSGTVGADPTDPTYWHVMMVSADAGTTVQTYQFIEIDYIVDFFDRNSLAISARAQDSVARKAARSRLANKK